jgi:hypothetical protein
LWYSCVALSVRKRGKVKTQAKRVIDKRVTEIALVGVCFRYRIHVEARTDNECTHPVLGILPKG